MLKIAITCNSDTFSETTNYEYIVSIYTDTGVSVPAYRVLNARDNNPRFTKVFRSEFTINNHSIYTPLPWDIVELISYHPVYKTKSKYRYYIEHSSHIKYQIVTDSFYQR